MAFFRKLKYISKHKKLSEEWALATNLKDFSGSQDDILDEESETESFSVKYLGNTVIESARSEEATAEAVKSIISTAKTTGKKLQRVELSISPKGIEMLDSVTAEPILQVSIYKISYCSADAVHGNVFAFVGTEDINTDSPNDSLVCYAFLCQKRKIAQNVTLTVARSFETAYQIWQETVQRKQYQLERRHHLHNHHNTEDLHTIEKSSNNNSNDMRNLLIDFTSEITAEICNKDHRDLLQNTWVSFDDDAPIIGGNQLTNSNKIQNNNMWENKNLIHCS